MILDTDEAHPEVVELFECYQQVARAARKAIEFPDQHAEDEAPAKLLHHVVDNGKPETAASADRCSTQEGLLQNRKRLRRNDWSAVQDPDAPVTLDYDPAPNGATSALALNSATTPIWTTLTRPKRCRKALSSSSMLSSLFPKMPFAL